MARLRRYHRPARYRDDDYWDDYRPRRRRGLRGCIGRLLWFVGFLLGICLLVLIVSHVALFLRIVIYALPITGIFAVLGILYLLIRLISAISLSLSEASLARAEARQAKMKAKQEQEKIREAKSKLTRDEYAFYDKHRERAEPPPHLGPAKQPLPRRATRNLALEEQQEIRQQEKQEAPGCAPAAVPSVTRLLTHAIRAGQTDMLHGFEVINENVIAIRGELPITAIIAGRGGSGKTRRMILMIFQALLVFQAGGGGTITVCDPHWIKPDGLANVLAPFANWLRFARTNEEIIAAAKEHIAEMESRLTPAGSLHGEGLLPRLIIYDEWGMLMKSEQISRQEKRVLMKCVRESAVQWRGVGGRAWIAGQEFTEDAIGDTAIRKDAQAIYCHQLSDEYASFLFPKNARAQRLVQVLARRECVYKDSDNVIKRCMTPIVADEEITALVSYLTRHIPQQFRPSAPALRQPVALQGHQTAHQPQGTVVVPGTPRSEQEHIPVQRSVTRILEATGFPDDAVLVPEPASPARTAEEKTTLPAMDDQAPQISMTAEQFALLARLQRKKER